MYAFISGVLEQKTETSLIIENGGMGYEVFASNNTLSNLQVGKQVKVYTYLYVREDIFSLFGFASLEEKNVFLDLITVSGVGAKTALAILSGISAQNLLSAIMSGDVKTISSAKGIGKKTAERIILELKGKYGDLTQVDIFGTGAQAMQAPDLEAVELLCSMGLTRADALDLVKKVRKDGDTTEVIIEKALRNMR